MLSLIDFWIEGGEEKSRKSFSSNKSKTNEKFSAIIKLNCVEILANLACDGTESSLFVSLDH